MLFLYKKVKIKGLVFSLVGKRPALGGSRPR